jgi:hypothetical protein
MADVEPLLERVETPEDAERYGSRTTDQLRAALVVT